MTNEQAQKVLDELQEVRPEKLNNEAKRLFEAIMSIADERDKLKKHNDDLLRKLRNRVKEVKKLQKYSLYKEEFSRLNQQLQSKDKIIDLMSEKIFEEGIVWENKEEVKQYFENKAKEK